jgi:nucleoid DNA-binding protein
MTKKDIVHSISEEFNLPQTTVKEVVQRTFDAVVETIIAEGRIELRNFGVFEVKFRKPRNARNPRTGEAVKVGERAVISFKAGRIMLKNAQNLCKKKKKKATKIVKE